MRRGSGPARWQRHQPPALGSQAAAAPPPGRARQRRRRPLRPAGLRGGGVGGAPGFSRALERGRAGEAAVCCAAAGAARRCGIFPPHATTGRPCRFECKWVPCSCCLPVAPGWQGIFSDQIQGPKSQVACHRARVRHAKPERRSGTGGSNGSRLGLWSSSRVLAAPSSLNRQQQPIPTELACLSCASEHP